MEGTDKYGMLCKVIFVMRLLVAKKLDEIIEGTIFFLILFFFIEFHHLELSAPRTMGQNGKTG
jgi:hypothetical protein